MWMGRTVPHVRGRIFGRTMPSHGGSLGSAVSAPSFSLAAPVVTLTSAVSVAIPTFNIILTASLPGDIVELREKNSLTFSDPPDTPDATYRYTLTSGDFEDIEFPFPGFVSHSNGPYSWTVIHEHGATRSNPSNKVSETIAAGTARLLEDGSARNLEDGTPRYLEAA